MAFIRMIALCNITRRFNDIVFKVMLRFYNPAAFRIIISKTISQICADDDYISAPVIHPSAVYIITSVGRKSELFS